MSDTEEDFKVIDDVVEQHPADEHDRQELPGPNKRKKQGVYKTPKENDRRKEQSKLNIVKAREARNKKLLAQKKERLEATLDHINEVELRDDDESDDEIILTKARKKKVKEVDKIQKYHDDRLDRIESILTKLARKHKPTATERKTIIQLAQPEQKKEDDEVSKHFKNKLLLKL